MTTPPVEPAAPRDLDAAEWDTLDDDAVHTALDRICRHLPPGTDDERAGRAALDREAPVGDLDAALDELVADVAEIEACTRELRYQVETVRRAGPKVGRNDPCP